MNNYTAKMSLVHKCKMTEMVDFYKLGYYSYRGGKKLHQICSATCIYRTVFELKNIMASYQNTFWYFSTLNKVKCWLKMSRKMSTHRVGGREEFLRLTHLKRKLPTCHGTLVSVKRKTLIIKRCCCHLATKLRTASATSQHKQSKGISQKTMSHAI